MTSSRPYLIRAIYDWISDNGLTPHLLVNAEHPGALVPQQYVKDGQVVLNVGLAAVQNLDLGNDEIQFTARFSGVATDVRVSPDAVLGIYARENGRGMLFPEDGEASPDDEPEPPTPPQRPTLKVVK